MAVREYVGARYVPLFADPIQWDVNTAYEPLTVVTNAGNSYTSIQAVPAGISIDNDKYWAETGNYNAQIEQYRKEVKQVQNDLTTVSGNVEANAENIQKNASAIADNAKAIKANTDLIGQVGDEGIDFSKIIARQMAAATGGFDVYVVEVNPQFTANTAAIMYLDRVTNSMFFKADITAKEAIPANSVMFSGAPKSAGNGNLRLFYGMNYENSKNFILAGATITADGTILTNSSIGSGQRCMFSFPIATHNLAGEYDAFPRTTANVLAQVVSTFRSYQGKFDYGNDIAKRLDPAALNTDCSGAIAMAFRANGIPNIPTYSDGLFGQGELIAYAEVGQTLDVSELQAGDIVAFSTNGGYDIYHVALAVSQTQLWEQNSTYYKHPELTKGPQPIDFTSIGDYGKNTSFRAIVRYKG